MATPVEEVKQRIDIVDFISEHIKLTPAGTNWKARCPFHNEKTPSFMVSRDRGTWHCFGCGRGGDVFSFVQELEGLEFPEALRLLANRAGVQLRDYDPKLSSQKTKVLDLLRWTTHYWQEVLRKSSDAAGAREYLKKRGLTDETIEDFVVGYAPTGGDVTYQALKKKGFADDDVFQAGLTIKKDRGVGYYDRFRGRIMFPINDPHGTVIGFSGRILESTLDPNRPVPPKYVNSPQTLVYNKSLVLYGLDKAKSAIKSEKKVVLVEGQMDCVASHQAGVTNVVATSGTALTRDQVQYLKRFTNAMVFSFDQDAAGLQATLRGVDQALQAEVDVTIVTLPSGKDPDDLIRHDPAAWKNAINTAKPILEYFFTLAMKNRDMKKVEDKKAVARELLPILAKVNNPIEQNHYLHQLAESVGVDEATLRRSIPKNTVTSGTSAERPAARTTVPLAHDRTRAVSERLLSFLLTQPKLIGQVSGQFDPAALRDDDLQRLYKTMIVWYTEDHLSARDQLNSLIAAVDPEQQDRFTLLLLLADKEYVEMTAAATEHELLTMVATLQRQWLSRQLRDLEDEIRRLEQHKAGSQTDLASLMERFRQVTDQLRQLPS